MTPRTLPARLDRHRRCLALTGREGAPPADSGRFASAGLLVAAALLAWCMSASGRAQTLAAPSYPARQRPARVPTARWGGPQPAAPAMLASRIAAPGSDLILAPEEDWGSPVLVDNQGTEPAEGVDTSEIGDLRTIAGGRAPIGFQASWLPEEGVAGQADALGGDWQSLKLAAPLMISKRHIYALLGTAERLGLNGDIILPDSGTPLPDELWNFSLGLFHLHNLDNGWQAGGMFTFGSPSDKPFGAWRDLTLSSLGFLTIPHGPRDSWRIGVTYSPTAQLNYPLPGLAYLYRPNDVWHWDIGVPFALNYRPSEEFRIAASYFPLTNGRVEASYWLTPGLQWYATYHVTNQTYWLHDRVNRRDRFYFFDQRVTVGARQNLPQGFQVDLAASYLFTRRIFQGEQFTSGRFDVLRVDPGFALTLELSWLPKSLR